MRDQRKPCVACQRSMVRVCPEAPGTEDVDVNDGSHLFKLLDSCVV